MESGGTEEQREIDSGNSNVPTLSHPDMKHLPTLFALALASLAHADTLAERLEARSKQAAAEGDPAVRAEFAKGIEAVAKSGIIEKAVNVGDKAPDFSLKNVKGEEVRLSDELEQGPVVLTWYRGGWCPYCNIALAALQERLPEIEAAGASLIALTPELPDKSLSTKEKNGLGFEVLTDLNHAVAKEYGVAFELTPKVRELYARFFDLTAFNGADAGNSTLPLAATYIIAPDGTVKWAFLDADYRKRAEPQEIIAFLHTMKPSGDPEE